MNIVFLIGNGFDLNIGLDTSYPKFYEWYDKISSSNESIRSFKQALNEEKNNNQKLWKDLELFIGEKSSLYNNPADYIDTIEDVINKLREFILIQDNRFDNCKDEAVNILKNDLIDPGSHLAPRSRKTYTSFYDRWNGLLYSVNIITFNYTHVLEKILGDKMPVNLGKNKNGSNVTLNSIKHIHGSVDRTILAGVDNVDQISNEKFRDNNKVKCKIVKPTANYSTELLVDEECASIISQANLICIFGCSLGPTDETWWRLVKKRIRSDKSNTLLLILDYDSERYNLQSRENDRGVLKEEVIEKFISKDNEFGDIKNNILVGLNVPIFNIKDKCVILPKETNQIVATNNELNEGDSFWDKLLRYDTISREEYDIMFKRVEQAFRSNIIPSSFVDFIYAIIRLAEIDANITPLSKDLKKHIKTNLRSEFDKLPNLEALNDQVISFHSIVGQSGIMKANNTFMNEIMDYFNEMVVDMRKTKKGLLVEELDNINNDSVNKLKYLLNEPSYDGPIYMYFPVFDKVNVDSFVESVLKLSNKSRKTLSWFFENKYLLRYRFNDDKYSEFSVEIDNLNLIIKKIEDKINQYSSVDRVSITNLLMVLRLAVNRCEGNKEVLMKV